MSPPIGGFPTKTPGIDWEVTRRCGWRDEWRSGPGRRQARLLPRTLAEAVPLSADESRSAHRNRSALRALRERCSSRWKCTASNLTGHLYTNPKMFTHTAADHAGFRCRHIESIFIVSGAARATQYLSDVGAWCENRGLRGDDLVVLLRGCRKFRVCEPYEEA